MMLKLLHAGLRRYLKSAVFWLGLVATVVCGILNGYMSKTGVMQDFLILIQFIIFAIMITWLVGREYDEGIFRNKVIMGHTRDIVFMSEFIIGTLVCLFFFLIHSAIFTAYNSYVFTVVPSNILMRIFFDLLIINITMSAFFISLACLLPNRAITAITTILFIFGLYFSSSNISQALKESETFVLYNKYELVEHTDPFGNKSYQEVPIPESAVEHKNPNYVDGIQRNTYEVLDMILPICHVDKVVSFLYDYMGFVYKTQYVESLYGEPLKSKDDFSITEEENSELTEGIIWSAGLFVVFSTLGYLGFRRREFK